MYLCRECVFPNPQTTTTQLGTERNSCSAAGRGDVRWQRLSWGSLFSTCLRRAWLQPVLSVSDFVKIFQNQHIHKSFCKITVANRRLRLPSCLQFLLSACICGFLRAKEGIETCMLFCDLSSGKCFKTLNSCKYLRTELTCTMLINQIMQIASLKTKSIKFCLDCYGICLPKDYLHGIWMISQPQLAPGAHVVKTHETLRLHFRRGDVIAFGCPKLFDLHDICVFTREVGCSPSLLYDKEIRHVINFKDSSGFVSKLCIKTSKHVLLNRSESQCKISSTDFMR